MPLAPSVSMNSLAGLGGARSRLFQSGPFPDAEKLKNSWLRPSYFDFVIPEATRRLSGIHTLDRGYGFPVRRFRVAPE